MSSWLSMRRELPGLRGMRIHVVDVAVEPLTAALSSLGFKIYTIDGSKIVDKHTFLAQVAEVFDFPTYFGHNWDALDECWGDLDFAAQKIAIIWKNAEQLLSRDVQTFLDAVCNFNDFAADLGTYQEDASQIIQMEVFLLGHGKGFNVQLDF